MVLPHEAFAHYGLECNPYNQSFTHHNFNSIFNCHLKIHFLGQRNSTGIKCLFPRQPILAFAPWSPVHCLEKPLNTEPDVASTRGQPHKMNFLKETSASLNWNDFPSYILLAVHHLRFSKWTFYFCGNLLIQKRLKKSLCFFALLYLLPPADKNYKD